MPCCQVLPTGPHLASLHNDALSFSQWIGGLWPVNLPKPASELTSALHVDLKLWKPDAKLGRPYQANDAFGNAWKVSRPRTASSPSGNRASTQQTILGWMQRIPQPAKPCHLEEFDVWLLGLLGQVRKIGLAQPGAMGLNPGKPSKSQRPTHLATYGMAQKLLNVFLKYQFCWQVAGHFGQPAPAVFGGKLQSYTCALHSPIDRQLLAGLHSTSVGQYLIDQGLWSPDGVQLRDSHGDFRPWSKLECLRTYYGFQWLLRRIAMSTWPPGCVCAGSVQALVKSILKGPMGKMLAPAADSRLDWISVVAEMPDNVISITAQKLTEAPAGDTKDPAKSKPTNPVNIAKRLVDVLPKAQAPRNQICINRNAKNFFGLRKNCSNGKRAGGNYWGNLSMPRGVDRRVFLALTQPAIDVCKDFKTIAGYQSGPSWTGGTTLVGHAPFNDTAEALIYLGRFFDLCACPDAVNELERQGVPIVWKCH